jgi:hypothetical protein
MIMRDCAASGIHIYAERYHLRLGRSVFRGPTATRALSAPWRAVPPRQRSINPTCLTRDLPIVTAVGDTTSVHAAGSAGGQTMAISTGGE